VYSEKFSKASVSYDGPAHAQGVGANEPPLRSGSSLHSAFGAYGCNMNAILFVIFGYVASGLLIGSLNCLFRTQLYRNHPSSRLVPWDNATCDFLLTCMFFWPSLVGRALSAKSKRGTRKGP